MAGRIGELNNMKPTIKSSITHAGHVPVKDRADGDRGGSHDARKHVSPLGGASLGTSTNNQIYAEKRDRAQSPMTRKN